MRAPGPQRTERCMLWRAARTEACALEAVRWRVHCRAGAATARSVREVLRLRSSSSETRGHRVGVARGGTTRDATVWPLVTTARVSCSHGLARQTVAWAG
eukprot:4500778-Prymnesium_polylepis.1